MISNNVVLRPANPQISLRTLIRAFCLSLEYSMTEHHLEFLSLREDCTGSSESTHVKIPHCWKSRVMAHVTIFPKSKF